MRQQAIITRIGSLAAEEQHGFPKDATELSADSSYVRRSHPVHRPQLCLSGGPEQS